MENFKLDIKDDIFNKIENIIDGERRMASYKSLKKFYKKKSNFKEILSDIKYIGHNLFEDDIEYHKFVKDILFDLLNDRISEEKDKKKNVKSFENFLNNKI